MRTVLAFILSLSCAFAPGVRAEAIQAPAVTTETTKAPRRPYFCAAMFSVDPVRNGNRHSARRAVTPPRRALERILEPVKPTTIFGRFVSWLRSIEEFFPADAVLEIPNVTAHRPEKPERLLIRKVLWRLRQIERDAAVEPNNAFIARSVIHGRAPIRAYLTELKAEAERLEAEHAREVVTPVVIPPRTAAEAAAARQGKLLKDFTRAMFYLGLGVGSGWASAKGYQTNGGPMFFGGLLGVVGVAIPGFVTSFKDLRISYRTYVEDAELRDMEDRQRDHDQRVARTADEIANIDRMLASLDADPATQANRFLYHGFRSELPLRSQSNEGPPPRITADAIVRAERQPNAYDPMLNRWAVVDQLFTYDDHGEPTLANFGREEMNFGGTYLYDAWIYDLGHMP